MGFFGQKRIPYEEFKKMCINTGVFKMLEMDVPINSSFFDDFNIEKQFLSGEVYKSPVDLSAYKLKVTDNDGNCRDMYLLYHTDLVRKVMGDSTLPLYRALENGKFSVDYYTQDGMDVYISHIESLKVFLPEQVYITGKVKEYKYLLNPGNIHDVKLEVSILPDAEVDGIDECQGVQQIGKYYTFSFPPSLPFSGMKYLTLDAQFSASMIKESDVPLECDFFLEVLYKENIFNYISGPDTYELVVKNARSNVKVPSTGEYKRYPCVHAIIDRQSICAADLMGVREITLYPDLNEVQLAGKTYKAEIKILS